MNKFENWDLSFFAGCEIVRKNDRAEIIVDEVEGRPIRLVGFTAPADWDNFEIAEAGHAYFRKLIDILSK